MNGAQRDVTVKDKELIKLHKLFIKVNDSIDNRPNIMVLGDSPIPYREDERTIKNRYIDSMYSCFIKSNKQVLQNKIYYWLLNLDKSYLYKGFDSPENYTTNLYSDSLRLQAISKIIESVHKISNSFQIEVLSYIKHFPVYYLSDLRLNLVQSIYPDLCEPLLLEIDTLWSYNCIADSVIQQIKRQVMNLYYRIDSLHQVLLDSSTLSVPWLGLPYDFEQAKHNQNYFKEYQRKNDSATRSIKECNSRYKKIEAAYHAEYVRYKSVFQYLRYNMDGGLELFDSPLESENHWLYKIPFSEVELCELYKIISTNSTRNKFLQKDILLDTVFKRISTYGYIIFTNKYLSKEEYLKQERQYDGESYKGCFKSGFGSYEVYCDNIKSTITSDFSSLLCYYLIYKSYNGEPKDILTELKIKFNIQAVVDTLIKLRFQYDMFTGKDISDDFSTVKYNHVCGKVYNICMLLAELYSKQNDTLNTLRYIQYAERCLQNIKPDNNNKGLLDYSDERLLVHQILKLQNLYNFYSVNERELAINELYKLLTDKHTFDFDRYWYSAAVLLYPTIKDQLLSGNYVMGQEILKECLSIFLNKTWKVLEQREYNKYKLFMGIVNQKTLSDVFELLKRFTILNDTIKERITDYVLLTYESNKVTESYLNSAVNRLKDHTLKSHWRTLRNDIYSLSFSDNSVIKKNKKEKIQEIEDKVMQSLQSSLFCSFAFIKANLADSECFVRIVQYKKLGSQLGYVAICINNRSISPDFIFIDSLGLYEKQLLAIYRANISQRPNVNEKYNDSLLTALRLFAWNNIVPFCNKFKVCYLVPDGIYNYISPYILHYPSESIWIRTVNFKPKFDYLTKYQIGSMQSMISDSSKNTTVHPVIVGSPDITGTFAIKQNYQLTTSNIDKSVASSLEGWLKQQEDLQSSKENETISHLLESKGWKSILLSDTNASEEHVKAIKNPFIAHYNTHGYYIQNTSITDSNYTTLKSLFDNNPYLQSGILLSGTNQSLKKIKKGEKILGEDGIFTAEEIIGLDYDSTYLVVLSACESGVGTYVEGSGVYSIARAFSTAGAKYVLSTLWKVDQDATISYMKYFYKHLLEGTEIHQCIELAQQDLKNENPEYNHPYYWAGYILIE